MIKLTKNQLNERETVVCLEGWLTAETVAHVRDVLVNAPDPRKVTLDLAGLTAVDAEGRALLAGLRRAGCRLQNASLYVQKSLEETSE